jgi:drug/metabolite transporter (DMT)-like permease
MEAVILSLLAACAWGVADFGAGLKARRLSVFSVVATMQLVGCAGAAAVLVAAHDNPLAQETAVLGLVSGAITAIGLTALYQALAIGPMSVVAPISATGVAIPVLVGLATGDDPSPAQGAGMLLAIAGMLVVVRVSSEAGTVAEGRSRTLALVLAALSAVGLGAIFLATDAVSGSQDTWYLLVGQLSAGTILAAFVLARRTTLPARADWPALVALGGISFAAWALSKAAFDAGHLSLTATIVALYPVLTVMLAVKVAGEEVKPLQALGLVGVFAGVALIAAG